MIVKAMLMVAIITWFTVKIESSKSRLEGLRLCERRSGLRHVVIEDAKWKNDDCAIDCVMHYAFMLAFYVNDGTPCRNKKDRCLLGQCRSPQKFTKPKETLYDTEIRIISAHVKDRDRRDTIGGSDTFIQVEVTKNGSPTYRNGDHVCYTNIIYNNNRPKWDYICKPLPMPTGVLLKFSASDCDNPFENPDGLGYHEEKLSFLMNKGKKRLTLINKHAGGLYSKHYVEVEVTGKPHKYMNDGGQDENDNDNDDDNDHNDNSDICGEE